MADTEGGEAAAVEDTRDYETEARKDGWVPEDEFKGDKKPVRFKTAKEFVEDGEALSPHMRRLLDNAKAEFKQELDGLRRVNEATITRLTKIHDGEIADLKAAKKVAVKAGDEATVDRIDAQLDKLREEAPLTDDPKSKKADAEKAFADANPWYGSNRKMTAFARGLSNDLAAESQAAGKPLSYDDNIRQVLVAVREEFPEYFEKKPAANGHAAVDGGSENGSAPSRTDPLAKLPNEARTQAKSDMKKFPKVFPTAESWLEAYQSK